MPNVYKEKKDYFHLRALKGLICFIQL